MSSGRALGDFGPDKTGKGGQSSLSKKFLDKMKFQKVMKGAHGAAMAAMLRDDP